MKEAVRFVTAFGVFCAWLGCGFLLSFWFARKGADPEDAATVALVIMLVMPFLICAAIDAASKRLTRLDFHRPNH